MDIIALLDEAIAFHQQGNLEQADRQYRRVLAIDPNEFNALHLSGVVQSQLGRHQDAERLIGRALEIDPNSAPAWSNRGIALTRLKLHDEALRCFDRALDIDPKFPDALCNRGNVFLATRRFEQALDDYDCALRLLPRFPDALFNRGNALLGLGRLPEALASVDSALALRPAHPGALFLRAKCLQQLGRAAEAQAAYGRLLEVAADMDYALGDRVQFQAENCDWRGFDESVERVVEAVRAGRRAAMPFIFLGVSTSPADQLTCATAYVERECPTSSEPLWRGERYDHRKIRVGYVSADYHEHAMANLMARLFEVHDRSRFEIVGLSLRPERPSAMRTRLVAAFDRFVDVSAWADSDVAKAIRQDEIDILVDLNAFTKGERPAIFAQRPAPIQVAYLGFPGTTGAGHIDYILADSTVIPASEQAFYTERVVHLPDSYQVTDNTRPVAATPTRAECGLPSSAFVFCCFNRSSKLRPAVFDVWMRILRETEGSVLWLMHGETPLTEANLRREASQRGVAPDRLVFAPPLPQAQHLARLRLADLVLDTLPYGAHTTASDALWVGVPVLTCLGTTFAGRVAASLLKAIGLSELITPSLGDYERLALSLATDAARLAALKAKLAANIKTTALFDTGRFCRNLEAAFEEMIAEGGRSSKAPRPL